MLQVRVNPNHRYPVHLAFSRFEFVKYEWRNVPEHIEKELRAHPEKYPELETREPVSPDAIETVTPIVELTSSEKTLKELLHGEKPTAQKELERLTSEPAKDPETDPEPAKEPEVTEPAATPDPEPAKKPAKEKTGAKAKDKSETKE